MADRGRIFGFEIQHIIPEQVLTGTTPDAVAARAFLQSIGFNVEGRGNKVALLIDPDTRAAIMVGPEGIRAAMASAGFGFNLHDSQTSGGNHPGYNAFVINSLANIQQA